MTGRALAAWTLSACAAPSPAPPPPPGWGQWVWTDADRAPLAEARRTRPVRAAVHVATTRWDGASFINDLALPPDPDAAVVIRLDDAVHAAWDHPGADAALDAAVGRVIALVRRRAPAIPEVQLDYDAPTRRVGAWAHALRTLRAGSLAGERVWITSLVAHAADPAWAEAMRGVVDGHLLQVFDTGDDVGDAARIGRLAADAGLPWRLAIGAFERDRTDHRAWFGRTDACQRPLCEAVWVFPAGQSWAALAR